MVQNKGIIFTPSLIEGKIVRRNSQFTMDVEVNDEIIKCHCPTTGRIGELDVTGVPCLLSESTDTTRKTKYTVEAVSLDPLDQQNKTWIGINQNAANRYVEYFLSTYQFPDMVTGYDKVLREKWLGSQSSTF